MAGDGPRSEDGAPAPVIESKPCYKTSVSEHRVLRLVTTQRFGSVSVRLTANEQKRLGVEPSPSGCVAAHVDLAGHGGGDEGGAVFQNQ